MENAVVSYGSFIQTVLDPPVMAFVVFRLAKAVNSFRRKEEAPAATLPGPSNEETCRRRFGAF